MIGGLGISASGVASAIRTASKARATMDTMARQIATGQRVASVKDDGAAFVRAAQLKSRQVENENRVGNVAMIRVELEMHDAQIDNARRAYQSLKEVALQALQHQPGTAARRALAADYAQSLEALRAGYQGAAIETGMWAHLQGSSADPMMAGRSFFTLFGTPFYHLSGMPVHPGLGWAGRDWLLTGTTPVGMDIANGSETSIRNGLANIDYLLNSDMIERHDRLSAASQAELDLISDWTQKDADRVEGAIGSLTDADMGQASTALRESQTRQQLALSTIQQAISAYGNFAGSLLGNVQRTQRGLLA